MRFYVEKYLTDDFAKELRSNGFDDVDWVLEWVRGNFEPYNVFTEQQLQEWAKENGYVLKGEE